MLTAADLPEGLTLERLAAWFGRFRFYRHPPSQEELLAWIQQFSPEDHRLAATILDQVVLLSDVEIQQGYHDALAALPGWSVDDAVRQGNWVFVGLGGQGESGQTMLHMFREAVGLTSDRFQAMFATPADLPALRLTAHDTVIFVDDFSGTGDQFSKHWAIYQELLSGEAKAYLFLAAATSDAMNRLAELQDIQVTARLILDPSANVFSDQNTVFLAADKAKVLAYCKKADRSNPMGWGKCGLLLVISRKTPNNSIPILHARSRKWVPVFPRKLHLQPVAGVGAP